MDSTRILSDFGAALRIEQIPESVLETTRIYIADYIAACYAGMKINETFNEKIRLIFEHMGGVEEASVFESSRKFPAEHAAFLNAVLAHGADMDDGNRKAMGHVAAHVMSAIFALAEALGEKQWGDVWVAINIGYEVYNRVAAAAQPGLVRRGFHSTGTAGAVACGAACAKLIGLNEDGIYSAMAIAAVQASGLLLVAESGQCCKPLNPANAARTGILSARLAAAGIQGPELPLESDKGWFHAMTDAVNERMITDCLGEVFTISESYLKPYPSCRHTHCGIEAALAVRQQMKAALLDAGQIRSIRLYIYDNAIKIAGRIRAPRTADEAKFSIHYSLAVALVNGDFTLQDLRAPQGAVKALIDRVELICDPSMENVETGIRGARLEVETEDGQVFTQTVLLPKGEAGNSMRWQDVRRKMQTCMSGILRDAQIDALLQKAQNLDPADKFSGVVTLIS